MKYSHGFIFLLAVTNASSEFACTPEIGAEVNSNYPRCTTIENYLTASSLRETPWISGNLSELLPPWTNVTLARKGQQFALDHVAGVVQAHMLGITLALANPDIRDTLLFTGNSNTVQKSGTRYAATLVQIGLWLRRALDLDPTDNWVLTSLANVRLIHSHVALRIGADLNFSSNLVSKYASVPINTRLWSDFEADLKESGLRERYPSNRKSRIHPMNQLSFATTQWSFLGVVNLSPEAVNVYYPTDEGLEAFAHLWAVVGHAMGIREEFNLGLGRNATELRDLSRQFFDLYVAPDLFNLSHESKFLMEVFIKSVPRIMLGQDPEFLLRAILRDILRIRSPKRMNGRRGWWGRLNDFVAGPVGPRWAHGLFPALDKITSPLLSLYHFVVGVIHFGWRYKSDQDIARFCYFYDWS